MGLDDDLIIFFDYKDYDWKLVINVFFHPIFLGVLNEINRLERDGRGEIQNLTVIFYKFTQ